jgi:hypothetical protein
VRQWGGALIVVLATVPFAIIGCADKAETSADDRADEEAVADVLQRGMDAKDPETQCSLLTDAGRRYVIENFGNGKASRCEDIPVSPPSEQSDEPAPEIGPVGVSGDFAVAVIRFGGETAENFVYTLRREGGEWLVDCPCVVPTPDQLEAGESTEAKDYVNSPEGLDAAGQEDTDGDFNPVIAVGDVALAYQADGGSAPTLLVNDGNGWRAARISVGAY